MEWMIWVWLGVTAVSLILEFVTMEMASIWFVAGGIVGMILAACGVGWEIQLIVFILVSLILLLSLRKIALKLLLKNSGAKTNASGVVGKKFKLQSAITEEKAGTIKINDVVWNVVSEDGGPIEEGSQVEIVEIKGNKYVVKKGDK